MSTIYDTYPIPQDRRCIRVLVVLPASSRLSVSETQQHTNMNPILRIDPPANNLDNSPHASLQFCFKIVDLDTFPEFTALSYVWGSLAPSLPTVAYSNTAVTVTENCYAALLHLRKALGSFTIWVDAICINQARENNQEKSAQLLLMGEIYSRASAVYIWLGESTPGTDRAIRHLDRGGFSRFCSVNEHGRPETRVWAALWAIIKDGWSRDENLVLFKTSRYKNNASAEDVEELLSRPWIQRLWTYQEILLASNPVIVCGDYHASWSNLALGIVPLTDTHFCSEVVSAHAWNNVILSRNQLRVTNQHAEFSGLTLAQYQEFIRRISRRHLILNIGSYLLLPICVVGLCLCSISRDVSRWRILLIGVFALLLVFYTLMTMALILSIRTKSQSLVRWKRLPIEDLTNCLYFREASEPKDMAFGIWAVLQKKAVGDLLPEITYADDLGHIYWTLAIQIIQRTSSIQLLYLAAAKGILGVPSWVPDWSARNGHQWNTVMSSIGQTDIYGRSGIWYSHFNIYRETQVSAYFELDATRKILTVHGRRVCDIRRLKFMDFQSTDDTFQEFERDIHLKNVGLMLRKASKGKRLIARLGNDDPDSLFPFDLLERAGKNRHDSWFRKHEARISKWTQFCRCNAKRSSSEVLALLERQDGPVNDSILETQIMISNLLAREGRPKFWSSRASGKGRIARLEGICGREVEIDDQVVRIMGLPQLLVLREIADGRNSARIVSPAALFEFSIPKGPSWPWQLGVANDENIVQYRIH